MQKIKDILPLRIIKTVLAFFISLFLAPFFYCDSFFAGLGSLRSMRESIVLSVNSLVEQIFANVLAFSIAIIFSSILGLNPYSVSLSLLVLFILIKKLDYYDSYLPAGVTLVALMLLSQTQEELIDRAFIRFYSTLFGMIVALIVNSILFKPKKAEDLTLILAKVNEFIHIYITHELDEVSYIELRNSLEQLEVEEKIIEGELKAMIVSKKRKAILEYNLIEINLVKSQCEAVFNLNLIDHDFQQDIIPLIVQLNTIQQYPTDKSSIPNLKNEIKDIYLKNTNDINFFINTKFLADLNTYINLLHDYDTLKANES